MNRPAADKPENAAPAATQTAGRSELIAALFREHNETLVQFLTTKLRSRQEAREVAQEAYVRILSLDTPGAVNFLRAFLFKTASNIAVDRIRHRERCPHTEDVSLFDELPETRTPEKQAEGTQEVELLSRLVAQLPPKCRQAFLLHRVHELSTGEIAQRMRLRERMVRRYVARALDHVRARLDEAHINPTDEGS